MKISLFVSTMLAFCVTEAAAQKIDPRCAKMLDKIGFTCAIEDGGYITRLGTWIASPPGLEGTNAGRYGQ